MLSIWHGSIVENSGKKVGFYVYSTNVQSYKVTLNGVQSYGYTFDSMEKYCNSLGLKIIKG